MIIISLKRYLSPFFKHMKGRTPNSLWQSVSIKCFSCTMFWGFLSPAISPFSSKLERTSQRIFAKRKKREGNMIHDPFFWLQLVLGRVWVKKELSSRSLSGLMSKKIRFKKCLSCTNSVLFSENEISIHFPSERSYGTLLHFISLVIALSLERDRAQNDFGR